MAEACAIYFSFVPGGLHVGRLDTAAGARVSTLGCVSRDEVVRVALNARVQHTGGVSAARDGFRPLEHLGARGRFWLGGWAPLLRDCRAFRVGSTQKTRLRSVSNNADEGAKRALRP